MTATDNISTARDAVADAITTTAGTPTAVVDPPDHTDQDGVNGRWAVRILLAGGIAASALGLIGAVSGLIWIAMHDPTPDALKLGLMLLAVGFLLLILGVPVLLQGIVIHAQRVRSRDMTNLVLGLLKALKAEVNTIATEVAGLARVITELQAQVAASDPHEAAIVEHGTAIGRLQRDLGQLAERLTNDLAAIISPPRAPGNVVDFPRR